MSEREKIISILQSVKYCDASNRCEECKYDKESENYEDMSCGSLRAADALIAAKIGDVTAWKERAEKHRVIALPGGKIKQLYSDEEVEQIAKERDELKERAGSEIKSCYKEIAQKRDEIAKLRKQLKCAQNAAKKQKHRAEAAEKALKLVSECDELSDAFCEARGGEDCDFRCNTCLYNYFLQQAEREIAKEEK